MDKAMLIEKIKEFYDYESLKNIGNIYFPEECKTAENTVKAKIGWSDLDFELKEIPQLVSDFIQIYGMIKPQLDTLSEAEEQKKSEAGEAQPDDKPIDLSEIPF